MTDTLDLPYAHASRVPEFLQVSPASLLTPLNAHHLRVALESAGTSQLRAWTTSISVVQAALKQVAAQQPSVLDWTVVLEYELPRERGRRPDVVLLTGDAVLVLEFKDHPRRDPAHVDQVAAYARDLAHYHAASHGRAVVPVLVYTQKAGLDARVEEVRVVGPGHGLIDVLLEVVETTGEALDPAVWLASDYEPLPSLVSAARRLFEHEPLPAIRRAASAGIPETVAHLVDIARHAQARGEHHLALVTGVPGAGKTLVGLQYVYANVVEDGDTARDAVFLSGNGPLVNVLQHALSSKVFVQGVHDFLKQYGGKKKRLPSEHIWVYDEAQRAWDAEQVRDKRGHATSEPEDFLRLGSAMPGWAMLVGLIGEGQEIHIGEEAGLTQWNDALGVLDVPWTVHTPAKIAPGFTNAGAVHTSRRLDLTVSLRSHLAEDLQTWVTQLLSGELDAARALLPRIREQGFEIYVTRDLDDAKSYVRARYEGMQDKRYGLLASSKASNLKSVGLDTWTQGVKHHKAGAWFNNPPGDPQSCCELRDIATEFVCQGLELDFPILCWGTDFTWTQSGWSVRPSRTMSGRRAPENPAALRLNSYRVLLSRGRDGMALYIPGQPALDETYQLLRYVGLPVLA